ncbi:MAG: hypothetical protein EB019_04620 [Actinobacteria bacterium]|nr:hypothetical protein [Actinomycetota bacterium]
MGAEGFVFISWSITTYALLSLEPMPNLAGVVNFDNTQLISAYEVLEIVDESFAALCLNRIIYTPQGVC